MLTQQLERLEQDSTELNYYIDRLTKQGNEALACDMIKKSEFLNQHIATLKQVTT